MSGGRTPMNCDEPIAEGWGHPLLSRKWHYFRAGDGFSLCRKFGFYMGERETGQDDSPDNCRDCLNRKKKLEAKAEKTA